MNYSIQPLRPLIVVVLALSLFFKFPPREEISLEASPFSSRIIARFILISSEEKDAERQSRPKKKSWFRSSNRQSTETRSFSPHPFSRVNAKALRSLTIERGGSSGMALCVFALRQFFTVFRKRFSWKAASLHETPFEHQLRTRAGPLHYIQDLLSPLCQRSKWPSENRVA